MEAVYFYLRRTEEGLRFRRLTLQALEFDKTCQRQKLFYFKRFLYQNKVLTFRRNCWLHFLYIYIYISIETDCSVKLSLTNAYCIVCTVGIESWTCNHPDSSGLQDWSGSDQTGMDWDGLDRAKLIGLDWIGNGWIESDWTGLEGLYWPGRCRAQWEGVSARATDGMTNLIKFRNNLISQTYFL